MIRRLGMLKGGLCIAFWSSFAFCNTAASSASQRDAGHQEDVQTESADEEAEVFFYDIKLLFGVVSSKRFYLGQSHPEVQPGLAITLNVDYYDFFLESGRKGRSSAVLGNLYAGYHLWQSQNASIDLISGNYTPAISKLDYDDEPIPELANLDVRKDDDNLGIRYSYFNEEFYYSSDIVYDVFGISHSGWVVDSYLGGLLTLENWDITYGLGHTWLSASTSDYYLGVDPAETTIGLTSYSGRPSYTLNFEFSAQYPISENWVFESGVSYNWFSDNISNSPLTKTDHSIDAFVGFGYVF